MRATPGRQGLSYEDVVAAAESIISTGSRATLRRVREKLGTGSLGTIQKHLAAWQDSRQDTKVTEIHPSRDLSAALLAELTKTAAEARAEALLELAEVKAARDELAEELETRVGELESAVATRDGTIAQLRENEATLSDRVSNLTRTLGRVEIQLEQIQVLRQTISVLESELKAEQDRRQAAEKQVLVHEQAADMAHLRATQATMEAAAANKTAERLLEELLALKKGAGNKGKAS